MKSSLAQHLSIWFFLLGFLAAPLPTKGQTSWQSLIANRIAEHESMGERYKAGDTNLAAIQIDSFYPLRCRGVSRSGKVFNGGYNGISDTGWFNRVELHSVSQTNLASLKDCINQLPNPPARKIATDREVHVSCERSNKWVHLVYDIDDPPRELTLIHELLNVPFYGSKFMKPVYYRGTNSP